jgi:hypothetical protein
VGVIVVVMDYGRAARAAYLQDGSNTITPHTPGKKQLKDATVRKKDI